MKFFLKLGKGRMGLLLFGIFLVCVLTYLFIPLSRAVYINSDNGSAVLEAVDILQGNWLLKGWYLSTESFFTTDIIFLVMGIPFWGASYKLLYVVPAVVGALIVVAAAIYNGYREETFHYKLALFTVVFLLILIQNASFFLLQIPYHNGVILYTLVCFFLLKWENTKPVLFLVWFTFLLTFSLIGDKFIFYIFVLPLLFLQTVDLLRGKKIRLSSYAAVVAIFLAVVIGKLVQQHGYYVVGLSEVHLVDYDKISHNFFLATQAILYLFNVITVDVMGKGIKDPAIYCSIGNGLLLCMALGSIIKALRSAALDRRILAWSCLFILVEFLASNLPVDFMQTRYLVPFFLFSSILLSSDLWEYRSLYMRRKSRLGLAICVLLLVCIGNGQYRYQQSLIHDVLFEQKQLTHFLLEKKLYAGYGEFWAANIVTVQSQGLITLRGVGASNPDKKVAPLYWLTKKEWYEKPANFLVINEKKTWEGLTREAAVKSFGEPDEAYKVSDYAVLVWKKDLSLYLIDRK